MIEIGRLDIYFLKESQRCRFNIRTKFTVSIAGKLHPSLLIQANKEQYTNPKEQKYP